MKTLRLILGDQLNEQHSWYRRVSDQDTYLLMEIRPEATYVTHHIQKVVGFFAAMREFAETLRRRGHRVIYLQFDDPGNRHSFQENVRHIINTEAMQAFEYQLPDEYRLDQQFRHWTTSLPVTVNVVDSEHFLTERREFAQFFEGKKTYVMENFYRWIRRRFDIMMENGKPLRGRWNFDAENRNSLPDNVDIPPLPEIVHSVGDLAEMISKAKIPTMGSLQPDTFTWPVNRREALTVLQHFLENGLPNFGRYQDAMAAGKPFLFHSRLSFALNLKMISPREVVDAAIGHWEAAGDQIDLAQVEGFVRQIIGWREYMRGIYWTLMPEFEQMNFLQHRRSLPAYFWSGDTKMNCLKQAIDQSLEEAYAHHIQRLMITGNFANLAGIHPDEVDQWYLGIYIDALQWVEITNTRGMSQFADGGLTATKPYVSSANYIRKMSDYCKDCHYDSAARYGDRACPFNSLYWAYFLRHRSKLHGNPRLGITYRNLDRMDKAEKNRIIAQANAYLDKLEQL